MIVCIGCKKESTPKRKLNATGSPVKQEDLDKICDDCAAKGLRMNTPNPKFLLALRHLR